MQQPLQMLCRPVWFDALAEREMWMWSWNENLIVSWHQMWDGVSWQGTLVHCHEGSGGPARTDEIVSASVLSANEVCGEVAICVPNSCPRNQTKRHHRELIPVVATSLCCRYSLQSVNLQPVSNLLSHGLNANTAWWMMDRPVSK